MEPEHTIVDKMRTLQDLFKSTQAFVKEGHELPSIVQFIHQETETKKEFISIAYEAVAMGLALQDLEKGTTLKTWQTLLNTYASQHATQVYIGLGWACAQQRLDPSIWIPQMTPLLAWRIWDGYGYYDGFFRKRKILQGTFPENISEKGLSVYWQGVGRSFWYTCKGDRTALQKIALKIPLEYKESFWRGIGIASTYVGGQSLVDCRELWELAGIYQLQLCVGATLAIKSRAGASAIVKDTEIIAQEWCKLPIPKIINMLDEKAMDATSYHTWIAKIEKSFCF